MTSGLSKEILKGMEIISCHAPRSYSAVDFKGVKDLDPHRPKLPFARDKAISSVVIESSFVSSRFSHLYSSRSKNVNRQRISTTVCSVSRYEDAAASVISENYESVRDGKRVVDKVSIPSLPDEGNGDNVAAINSCFWEWKPNFNVHYETSGSENVDSPPILFLPGFGVGSFHYKKQLKDLGRDYRAWALDYLGQGMSLPNEDPTLQFKDGNKYVMPGQNDVWGFGDESETWAEELVYSADLWRDQIRTFIEEVIKEPVYLVGNSLGGFMALYFAACYPHLVKGVTLLNATPVWGFLPNPQTSPRWSRLFPWAGTFPLPSGVRKLVQVLWQKISDPASIAKILEQVYADHSTNVDDVFTRIVETTQHPAAAASFASIMFAPKAQFSFKEALSRCQINNTPICLAYGKEDPWVMPICGIQVKNQLPNAPYYEISPAGHCPHDEVPEVVNFLVRGWIKSVESGGTVVLPLLDDSEELGYEVTKDLEFSRGGSNKLVRVQFHGSNYSLWSWFYSQFKPLFERVLSRPSTSSL